MRAHLALLVAIVMLLAVVAPGFAVTYGEPDGNAHPYVGLVVFYDAAGRPWWRCSGTLITPRILLTAGHCTADDPDLGADIASAQVWFASTVTTEMGYPFTGGVKGTPVTHPFWDNFASFPNTHDVGLVLLQKNVKMDEYGQLPTEDSLSKLATRRGLQDVTFTVVGYGLQEVRPVLRAERTRYRGTSILVNLKSALTDGFNIHLSNNNGVWAGGACFGDSGGPVFVNDSMVIAGINSFVLNENCKGSYFATRADTFETRQFLDDYVQLP